ITTAMIDSFVADQPADLSLYGLDKPSHVLTVEAVTAADVKPDDTKKDDGKKDDDRKEDAKKDEPGKPTEKVTTYKLAIGAPADISKDRFYAQWQDIPVVFTLRK